MINEIDALDIERWVSKGVKRNKNLETIMIRTTRLCQAMPAP
jgi:hypothetical protein